MSDSKPNPREVCFLYFKYLWDQNGDIRRSRLIEELWGIDHKGIINRTESIELSILIMENYDRPSETFLDKAYNWFKARMSAQCFCIVPDLRREAGNMARNLGIHFDFVAGCQLAIMTELIAEVYKPKN